MPHFHKSLRRDELCPTHHRIWHTQLMDNQHSPNKDVFEANRETCGPTTKNGTSTNGSSSSLWTHTFVEGSQIVEETTATVSTSMTRQTSGSLVPAWMGSTSEPKMCQQRSLSRRESSAPIREVTQLAPNVHLLKQVRQSAAEMSRFVRRVSAVNKKIQHHDQNDSKSYSNETTSDNLKDNTTRGTGGPSISLSPTKNQFFERGLKAKKEKLLQEGRYQKRLHDQATHLAAAAGTHIQQLAISDPILGAFYLNEEKTAPHSMGDAASTCGGVIDGQGDILSPQDASPKQAYRSSSGLSKPTRLQKKLDLVKAYISNSHPINAAYTTFSCQQLNFKTALQSPHHRFESETSVVVDSDKAKTRRAMEETATTAESLVVAPPTREDDVSMTEATLEGLLHSSTNTFPGTSIISDGEVAAKEGCDRLEDERCDPSNYAGSIEKWMAVMGNGDGLDTCDPEFLGEKNAVDRNTHLTGDSIIAGLFSAKLRTAHSSFTCHHEEALTRKKHQKLASIAKASPSRGREDKRTPGRECNDTSPVVPLRLQRAIRRTEDDVARPASANSYLIKGLGNVLAHAKRRDGYLTLQHVKPIPRQSRGTSPTSRDTPADARQGQTPLRHSQLWEEDYAISDEKPRREADGELNVERYVFFSQGDVSRDGPQRQLSNDHLDRSILGESPAKTPRTRFNVWDYVKK